jgi:hypothetical protein
MSREATSPDVLPSLRWPDDVAHLRWPAEAARRQHLAGTGAPRLLHVDAGVEPPNVVDELEDWMWAPNDPADAVEAVIRARTLSERFRRGTGVRPDAAGGA